MLEGKRVRPIEPAGEGIFDTDEELGEFLSWVSAERKAHLA
ncbi:MAG TPA: hypothetical protein VJT49_31775 [Amycolatopsis sp.]|nr:hypothetical protein [Amycolatopsis sp.]HKS49611.1 hypothetical protein [Amycolatopsis sp.]